MKRLIDANALRDKLQAEIDKGIPPFDDVMGSIRCGIRLARNIVEDEPTIDAEPQWIPCSERLPEDDRSKVVTLANGNAEVGYYSNGDWWCVGDEITLENQTVIAWMPLPEPYEVEE